MDRLIVYPFGLCCIFFFAATNTLSATTIVPYKNLGELAHQCDAMVIATVVKKYEYNDQNQIVLRNRLEVKRNIKGNLEQGQYFEVQNWEKKIDDLKVTMWGDISLYDHANYLLFLEHREGSIYHPIGFSYYLFEEISREGTYYLVPSIHSLEFEVIDIHQAEPLHVYKKKELLTHLDQVVRSDAEWNNKSAKTELQINDFYSYLNRRSAPSGCTFLTIGGKKIRWQNFETQNVGVHYSSYGAAQCASAVSDVSAAIATMSNAYQGINILDAGTENQVIANCDDGSAIGADFRSFIDTEYGSNRHVVVQFDDPCGEISDLSNCSGVLAIGGVYASSSHTFDDTTWANAKYGYVVLNNGVGACRCDASFPGTYNLQKILTHELTHSLGLGHISSSEGAANMNPGCCGEITGLDQSCVAYSYPESSTGASVLPIDLISFSGYSGTAANVIEWLTGWERDVSQFTVERSTDSGAPFEAVFTQSSKGDSDTGHEYGWIDKQPYQQSYYRLRTQDFNGDINYSKIIEISRSVLNKPIVYPTLVTKQINIRIAKGQTASLQINNIAGRQLKHKIISGEYSKLDIGDLPSGWYFIQISDDVNANSYKVYKPL